MLKIFKKHTKKQPVNYDRWLDELNVDVNRNPIQRRAIENALIVHRVFGEDAELIIDRIRREDPQAYEIYKSIIALEA